MEPVDRIAAGLSGYDVDLPPMTAVVCSHVIHQLVLLTFADLEPDRLRAFVLDIALQSGSRCDESSGA